ncbi:MAG: DUF3052 family protein [Acidimicrobiia bacterium]|nr:DUF3052 domain-containing protein [Acidimicrobiia bacterium]MBT8194732.1 DUF3052 domain-containing protein [Acidimicrobiia bacterium]MBT8248161.1 DUF3052 domain-containing protein [Acidimicrobiia bacterium]NNF89656.1 DUF3052 family protein [Acidimicrobiia bacterium]NNJ47681.1 DUF3052 family protein [Acidimicrobiia bacterium]
MDLTRRLGIRPGGRFAFSDPPVRFRDDLGPLPESAVELSLGDDDLSCIVLFVKTRSDLSTALGPAVRVLAADGALWIAWPKQLSGYATDVSAEVVQAAGLKHGLLDTRRLSLNDGWTATRFIVRLDDREAWSKRSFDE